MKYVLSQGAADKVRELINRRQDGGGTGEGPPRIARSDVDYILVTADNGDDTYDGTIQRYIGGTWTNFAEVTVVEANTSALRLDKRYRGVKYAPALYVVSAADSVTDIEINNASICSPKCPWYVIPKTWTLLLQDDMSFIENGTCSDCEALADEYELEHVTGLTWEYADSDVEISYTINGPTAAPQAVLTITIVACAVTWTFEQQSQCNWAFGHFADDPPVTPTMTWSEVQDNLPAGFPFDDNSYNVSWFDIEDAINDGTIVIGDLALVFWQCISTNPDHGGGTPANRALATNLTQDLIDRILAETNWAQNSTRIVGPFPSEEVAYNWAHYSVATGFGTTFSSGFVISDWNCINCPWDETITCCGGNSMVLMGTDAACDMVTGIGLVPGDEVIYQPIHSNVISGGTF